MTPFTYATSSGTLVIGDDPGHVFIEIFDGNDRAYASIPNSAVLGVAAALLEAAGYGREAAALPKAALDEMTRTASEDGTADAVDEFINTRPTFAVGDRVQQIEDAEHGTVRGLCYWTGCDIKRYMKECFRVEWDADPDNRQHHDPAELKRIDNTLDNPKGGGMTRIALADRVVAVVEEDRPGIVTTRTFTRMGDPAWMVLWDDDPEEDDGPYQDWELRKVDGDD